MTKMIDETAVETTFSTLTEAYIKGDFVTFDRAASAFKAQLKIRDTDGEREKEFDKKIDELEETIKAKIQQPYMEAMKGKDSDEVGRLVSERDKEIALAWADGVYSIICEMIGRYSILPTGVSDE